MLFINNLKYNERGVLMDLIISAIAQGALWGLLSLGLFISFRVLNIADMTTEGAYPLGAGVCVICIQE